MVRRREVGGGGGGGGGAPRPKPPRVTPETLAPSPPSPDPPACLDPTPAYAPATGIALKMLLIVRFSAALMANIGDCDEVYNYWEPAHYVLYKSGFQTWEYSPQFALRSYAYIWLYAGVIKAINVVITTHRLVAFFLLRCVLALLCACLETLFYRCVCRLHGPRVARLLLVFLVFSPGMFAASVAFLPSSFSLYMCLLSYSALILGLNSVAIVSIAASVLLAWPFSAILGLPVALDILLVQRRVLTFVLVSLLALLSILAFMLQVDSYYYNKPVLATWNIVHYNIFTPHGPDLYGTEPVSYYIINGFLNLPVTFFISFLIVPVSAIQYKKVKDKKLYWKAFSPFIALALWIVVFFAQPHKEERFLFPIYPLICLAAAVSLACIVDQLSRVPSLSAISRYVLISVVALAAALGVCRQGALLVGYHAPLDVWGEFGSEVESRGLPPGTVCMGREWHRFPSSFFLPDHFHMHFIQSHFNGQLPAHYAPSPDAASIPHAHFNHMNREEPSRYTPLDTCRYLVDRASASSSPLEPAFANDTGHWQVIVSRPFLEPAGSHPLCRAFYLPFLSAMCSQYTQYVVLMSKS